MAHNRIIQKTGKIIFYIIGILLLIVCVIIFFISIPYGKRVVKNQVQSYLSDKLKTKVVIGAVDYKLPTWVEIKNVYIEDQNKDTLIYGEQLTADVNMFKLIRGNTDIKKLLFKNILINISRKEKDTAFNFQFVMDAFTGNKATTKVDPDTAALKLTLDRLVFDNVGLKFKDDLTGSSFITRIKNLDATIDQFQPDRLRFAINDFTASGVDFFMNTLKAPIIDSSKIEYRDSIRAAGYELYITANKFKLRDVNVTVDNKYSGLYYANAVTQLGLSSAVFDMYKLNAFADSLTLDSSFVQFSSPRVIEKNITDTASAPAWIIKVKETALRNNHVRFDDDNIPASGGLDFSHFNAKSIYAGISSFIYSEDSTSALVKQFSFRDTSGFVLDSTHANLLFTDTVFSVKELYVRTPHTLLQNFIEVRYDSVAGITKYPENSTVNAVLNNSILSFDDLFMMVPAMKKSLSPAQFRGQSVRFNTELRGSLKKVYIPYLQLSGLSGSSLSARGNIYNLTDPERFSYDLFILNGHIKKSDLLRFVPAENQSSFRDFPAMLDVSGHFVGDKNNLAADVNARGNGIAFEGRINLKNILNPDKLQYDLAIKSGTVGKALIMGFIPVGALPPNINLPDRITASGTFKGDKNNFTGNLKLNTSYGLATLKGYIHNMQNPQAAVYDLFITTNNFDLGRLMGDTMLGVATLSAKAKGKGFDYMTMQSAIQADISQIEYNNYNYQDAHVNSNLDRGSISGEGSINDSNLKLNFSGNVNVAGQYPSVTDLFVRVDTARLYKLNLYSDTLNVSFTAHVNAASLRPRRLDASAVIDSIMLQYNNNFYALDSVSIIATSENGVDDINLHAPFADINANGAFDYDQVGQNLLQYVDHYYNLGDINASAYAADQQLAFTGVIRPHQIVKDLVPGLDDYENINFKGNYSSANKDSALSFNADIPYLAYQSSNIRNGKITIGSYNEKINYDLTFDTLHYVKSTFYGTRINGAAANDSLSVNAITQDNNRRDWFGANAAISVNNDEYIFTLKDNLLLNYERWNVAPDNYVRYSPDGILVHNFSMNSDTARISINSQQEVINSPIDVSIDNFNLRSISTILSSDTLFTTGVMDAKITVSDLNKQLPGFTGNAQITDFHVMNQPVGTVTFAASKQSESVITGSLDITGNGNNISSKGNYYLNNTEQEFDAEVNVQQLNIATLQGFSTGMIKNATGNIHGKFDLEGKFSDPRWNGELNFDTTRFTISQLGSPYLINNQKIILAYPDIEFDNFELRDSLNNKMTVDGLITSNTLTNYDLDLNVNAVDFILVNAPKAIDNQFYGFASVDANISVTGNSETPDIDGDIFVNDKSDLTIIIPEQSFNKDEAKTVVRFIDRDTFDLNPPVILFQPAAEPTSNFARFLNYNLNIEINKNSKLSIIIDPVTGDEIKVQGDAQLNAGVDPGGNIILAGNYNLDQGSYVLNYQFLQRKFNLMQGSSIAFSGEPMDARIDITAEYIANTSAKDLLFNEVGSVDPLLANSFNQKIPFRVILKLTGQLAKPVIAFDILLPEETAVPISSELHTTIDNKLNQIRGDEAATTKQVFSLLLLGRFVGEQSSDFFRGNGGGFNDIARQSVSQFLSSALDEIASNLFKGIDIDLNLNSYQDYSTATVRQRTDLNVTLSKTFLNDRLTVSVGTNIGIEGQDPVARAGKSNSSFMPDVTLAYKLTKDGRYMIRAYRRNQFEVVLDGYVVENGLGFIVTMDYDKFHELFGKRK